MEDDYEDDFEAEQTSGESSRHVSHNLLLTPRHVPDKTKRTVPVGRKKPTQPSKSTDLSPHSRLISSKDHEIRGLRNQLTLVQNQLKDTIKENRLIKRLQTKYERELNSISKQEGELPNILRKHAEEVRVLRTQLHRSQLNNSDLQKRVQELGTEMLKSQDKVKKLDELTKKRNLPAREQLVFQLQELKERYQASEQRATKLEHSLELTQKSHSQEVKQLLSKYRAIVQELEGMKEENKVTRWQLKERERLLDVTNIYTQRVQPHHSLPPLPMTDNVMTQTIMSHPPFTDAILKTKPTTVSDECQTDSAWLTEILTNKHQAATHTDSKLLKRNSTQAVFATHPTIATGTTPIIPTGTTPIIPTGTTPIIPTGTTPIIPTGTTSMIPKGITSTEPVSNNPTIQPVSITPTPITGITSTISPAEITPTVLTGNNPTVPPAGITPNTTPTIFGHTPVTTLAHSTTISQYSTTPSFLSHIAPAAQPKATLIERNEPAKTGSDTLSELLGLKVTTSESPPPLLPNLKTTPPQVPVTTADQSPPPVQSNTVYKSDEVKRLLFGSNSSSLLQQQPVTTTTATDTSTRVSTRAGTSKPPPIDVNQKRDLLDKLFPQKTDSSSPITITATTATGATAIGTELASTKSIDKPKEFSKRFSQLDQKPTITTSTTQNNDLLKKLFPSQPSSSVTKETDSTPSNVPWPERIENLHHGLPALSSDTDPYGTNSRRKSSNGLMLRDNSSDKERGGKRGGEGEGGIRYGRRAPIETKPIFGETNKDEVKGINPTFGNSSGGGSDHYPWEIPVNTSDQLRRVGRLGVANSNHSVPPPEDDIEEIVI